MRLGLKYSAGSPSAVVCEAKLVIQLLPERGVKSIA
jgi:hypothetical protein